MSALERLLAGVLLILLLAGAGWLERHHYGAAQYQAGYDAAVAAGKERHDADTLAASAIESGLRTQLLDRDAAALRQKEEHDEAIAAVQRRLRAGTDRLLCPTASPVHEAAAPGDRPATAEPAPDGERPAFVPEAAADYVRIAGDVDGLVSRYQQVVERFEACRAVNAK